MSKIKFKFFTDDMNWQDYGGTWISQPFSNGEFEYYFACRLINWNEHASKAEVKELGTYNVSLSVVAPSKFKYCHAVMECMGLEEWDSLPEFRKAVFVFEYSGGVPIWDANGSNYKKLFKQAREYAVITEGFAFGFMLDKHQNAMGATGWDFLEGDVYPESMRANG